MPNDDVVARGETRAREASPFHEPEDGFPPFWLRLWSLLHDDGEPDGPRKVVGRRWH